MAEHGIIGDETGMNLPVTDIPQRDLMEEKKMARFSKTDEFKRIKDYAEGRIEFYQQYLPDGRPINSVKGDLSLNWMAANLVIGEFKSLLNAYEQADEVVRGRTN